MIAIYLPDQGLAASVTAAGATSSQTGEAFANRMSGINSDPDYLRKTSQSLRAKLSLPLRVYNPSFDNLHAAKAMQDVNGISLQSNARASDQGAVNINIWAASPPSRPKPSSSPAPQHARDQNQCEKRGTRSGPYEGHASGKWLEKEMRAEIDALAAAVDKACNARGSLRAMDQKSDLELQVIDLTKLVTEQQRKIAELELLIPTDDGNKALRKELAELEADADYYYGLYKKEEKEKHEVKREKEEAMAKALEHIKQLEIDFAAVRSQLEAYASRDAAQIINAQMQASRQNELGLDAVLPMAAPLPIQMPPPHVIHQGSGMENQAVKTRSGWCCSR